MHHFIKVCTVTPKLSLGDCFYNAEEIINCLKEAAKHKAVVAVFPELCLTGYYCEDLFFQSTLLDDAEKAMMQILEASKNLALTAIVGVPIRNNGNLYNCALVFCKGKILGIVPKTHLPNYGEFYEKRWFTPSSCLTNESVDYAGEQNIPMSGRLIFKDMAIPELVIGIDVCEDLWAAIPPSSFHALAGATLLVNLSASNELIGKAQYRRDMVAQHSARTMSAYLYTSSSVNESTTDLVFSGHQMIYENGYLIAESALFSSDNTITYGTIDLERLFKERLRRNDFLPPSLQEHVKEQVILFDVPQQAFEFERYVDAHPFVPYDEEKRKERCKIIFDIQSHGLARRMKHAKSNYLILGMSGGLDSTLALLVCLKAVHHLGLPPSAVMGVTMPGFGTTDRTYQNAIDLMRLAGITVKEISIVESAAQHLKDIGHALDDHDVTYENAQARERTQILMDLANMYNGIVVGTGDLSEFALGWATFNGDHMSMYGVNTSVPKTLVRYLIDYVAHYESEPMLQEILFDILETPVSPELLPPDKAGQIAQKTEDVVGPYELHDFFIYYMLRFGYKPGKVFFLAQHAFKGQYTDDVILKWMEVFYKRFFIHQFKRSSLPDGPKVGSICLSPRGDLRMPSDASGKLWLDEIKSLK